MNYREVNTTRVTLGPLLTLLLTIAGGWVDVDNGFPSSVARIGRTSIDGKPVEHGEASTALRSVRRWPQDLGPFVMMVLTLRRQRPGERL